MIRSTAPRTCEHCGKSFQPWSTTQRVCPTLGCAKGAVKAKRAKEREEVKTRRKALETIPELIKAAQKDFNAYIRERDKDQPCICCGRTSTAVQGLGSHGWDAGHYRSTGSASHLRFHEDNCHRQLVYCNRHRAGRAVDYRIGLLGRIGEARVLALEADNKPHKWTREELITLRATYKARLKQLKEAT